jgi:8-oxo-dGTP pyrophosphatase MutT (NUDIX family)
MEKLIINKDKLTKEEINKTKIKSRIIILNNKNELILCNYNGCYLLIGGKVEKQETIKEAALRETHEEIGVLLNENDLDDFILIEHYQKNYPTIDNKIKNNLLITYYFISKKKVEIEKDKITLSENEKKQNFKLVQASPKEIIQLLENNNTQNPRAVYYEEELQEVLQRIKIK